jgi:hypothetical protein
MPCKKEKGKEKKQRCIKYSSQDKYYKLYSSSWVEKATFLGNEILLQFSLFKFLGISFTNQK